MNIYYAVEPRYNEPLYNEVLGMMNIFLPQRIVKYIEKNLDIRTPR